MAKAAAMFLATGLLLSGIAVVGATVTDQTFRLPVEVSRVLNLPVLATLSDASAPAPARTWGRKKKEPGLGETIPDKSEAALPLPPPPGDLPTSPDSSSSEG